MSQIDSINNKNHFHFMITIKEHDEECDFNLKSTNDSTIEIFKELLGEEQSIKDFFQCVAGYSISIWDEVLTKEMLLKFKKKGVFSGVSITKRLGDEIRIFCCGLTKSDEKPITKCLNAYIDRFAKVVKEHNVNHSSNRSRH